MHEMSFATQILDVSLSKAMDRKLKSVTIGLGALGGVDKESLQYALSFAAQSKGCENMEVIFHDILARVRCSCGREYETAELFGTCPDCGSLDRTVISGTDCMIESIEVEA